MFYLFINSARLIYKDSYEILIKVIAATYVWNNREESDPDKDNTQGSLTICS